MPELLYLEDDQALAFVTSRALTARGFVVHHFAELSALIAALPNLSPNYALLDLKIGNATSLELIGQIQSQAAIPVVVLTGYGTIRAAVQAMKLGAVDFLTKPCNVDEIVEALTKQTITTPAVDEVVQSPSLKNTEWEAIQKALDDNEGNISAAARQLKLHRRTLQRKLQKKHLEQDGDF